MGVGVLEESASSIEKKFGAILAIYFLYRSQPCQSDQIPMPIPIDKNSLQALNDLYQISITEHPDISYSIYWLITNDAFQMSLQSKSHIDNNSPGGGDMIEIFSDRQLERIENTIQDDLLMNSNYVDMIRVATEYDALMKDFLLPNSLAQRRFPLELDKIRDNFSEGIRQVGVRGGDGKKKKTTINHRSKRFSITRRATISKVPLIRPSTAPPTTTAVSLGRYSIPGSSADMPDFSFLNVPLGLL